MVPELYGIIEEREFNEAFKIYNAVYYHLKPELLANQYSNIDYRELIRDLNGWYPPTNWSEYKFASLLRYRIPGNIILILDAIRNRYSNITSNERIEYERFVEDVNRTCFSEYSAIKIMEFIKDSWNSK